MTPELLLLIMGSLGATGAGSWWWLRRASRDHVIRTRTAWVRGGRIIRFGPVGAVCLGHSPRERYPRGVVGALGLSDRTLSFDGYRAHSLDRDVPLDQIARIMLTPARSARAWVARARPALSVLYADGGRWHVSTFLLDDPLALAEALAQHSDAPIDQDSAMQTFGPAPASRLELTAAGDWLPDRDGDLYLAPGLLIFNWADALPLGQIAHLDTFGGARRLLRVETTSGAIIGFELADPEAWADALHAQSDLPIARHTR